MSRRIGHGGGVLRPNAEGPRPLDRCIESWEIVMLSDIAISYSMCGMDWMVGMTGGLQKVDSLVRLRHHPDLRSGHADAYMVC